MNLTSLFLAAASLLLPTLASPVPDNNNRPFYGNEYAKLYRPLPMNLVVKPQNISDAEYRFRLLDNGCDPYGCLDEEHWSLVVSHGVRDHRVAYVYRKVFQLRYAQEAVHPYSCGSWNLLSSLIPGQLAIKHESRWSKCKPSLSAIKIRFSGLVVRLGRNPYCAHVGGKTTRCLFPSYPDWLRIAGGDKGDDND